jgi:hypothetical protein
VVEQDAASRGRALIDGRDHRRAFRHSSSVALWFP